MRRHSNEASSELTAVIRPLHADDVEPLSRLLAGTGVFWRDEIDIALELMAIVLDEPHQKDYIINVLEEEGSILGYYCVGPTPATKGTFDLYWIAVASEAQGKGIGGMLSDHAEELIASMGGRLIVAETSGKALYEKTRRFYAIQGYAEVSRIPDYYAVGDDLVVFAKYLFVHNSEE